MTQEIEVIKSPQEYLPEGQMKEIALTLTEAKQKAISIRVVSDEAMEEANALCGTMRAKQKGIESFRLAIVKPFKDHIASIDKFFKDLVRQFDEPLGVASDKVLKYREKKIEAERKERERLEREAREKEEKIKAQKRKEAEELAAKGQATEAEKKLQEAAEVKVEVKEPKKAALAKSSYQTGVGITTFVKDAEYRVESADLIPEEFYILDEKKIGARVRELTSGLEVGKVYRDLIPGVVVTCIERPSYKGDT